MADERTKRKYQIMMNFGWTYAIISQKKVRFEKAEEESCMKILMVNVPFSGHINPTLALAEELVRRGHKVSYILNNEWKEQIEGIGAEFIPYMNHGDFWVELKNGHPKHVFKVLQMWKYVYDTIMAVGEQYDVLIYEFYTFIAYAAGRRLELKVIRQFTTFAVNENNINIMLSSDNREMKLLKNKLLLKLITKIVCGKRKLSTENILTEITKVPVKANIVYTSKDFQINKEEFGEEYCFAGPMISKRNCDIHIPYEKITGKIIYISLGTIQNEQISFYKKCIDAWKASDDVSVIMSVGKKTDIQKLMPFPHNFYIYHYVPQLEVLEKSSVFITHGGMNSVNEGLYFENRILGIPMDVDQYAVVEQVEKLKLGYGLEKERVTPGLLREKVKELLLDDEIGHKVKDMSKIMRNAGGVKRAAEFVETVVWTKQCGRGNRKI